MASAPSPTEAFEEHKGKVFESLTPDTNEPELGKILSSLDPSSYPAVLEDFKKKRQGVELPADYIAKTLAFLRTPEQALALCTHTNFKISDLKGGFKKLADILATKETLLQAVFLHLHPQIVTADDIDFVLEKLTQEQRSAAYEGLKEKLLADNEVFLTDATSFLNISRHLSDKEKTEYYDVHKNKINDLIKHKSVFFQALDTLPEINKKQCFANHEKNLLTSTKTLKDFNTIAEHIPSDTCNSFFTKIETQSGKLKGMLKAGSHEEITTLKTKLSENNIAIADRLISEITAEQAAETVRTFLSVYYALLSMASFPCFRSDKWKNIKGSEITNENATSILNDIQSHQSAKPGSRTAEAMGLVTQYQEKKLNKDQLVLAVMSKSFKEASAFSSVKLDGQRFFRADSLNKYLEGRAANTALTGDAADKIKTALGFTP